MCAQPYSDATWESESVLGGDDVLLRRHAERNLMPEGAAVRVARPGPDACPGRDLAAESCVQAKGGGEEGG
jgi:hypothetical protein